MLKKYKTINTVSAASFIVSSVSLLFIPFLENMTESSRAGFIIALIFWTGLLLGFILQGCLALKCNILKIKKNTKKLRLPFFIAGLSFLFLIILVILKSNNSFMVVGALFCMLLPLQLASVIKRKECLK